MLAFYAHATKEQFSGSVAKMQKKIQCAILKMVDEKNNFAYILYWNSFHMLYTIRNKNYLSIKLTIPS